MKPEPIVRICEAMNNSCSYPAEVFKIVRAVVKAVIPGKQTSKNAADSLDKAVTAACRTIRRLRK